MEETNKINITKYNNSLFIWNLFTDFHLPLMRTKFPNLKYLKLNKHGQLGTLQVSGISETPPIDHFPKSVTYIMYYSLSEPDSHKIKLVVYLLNYISL